MIFPILVMIYEYKRKLYAVIYVNNIYDVRTLSKGEEVSQEVFGEKVSIKVLDIKHNSSDMMVNGRKYSIPVGKSIFEGLLL